MTNLIPVELPLSTIECPHCGDSACTSDEYGEFTDGQCAETGCENCEFPGHVSADDESEPYWCASDVGKCDRDVCDECGNS